MDESGTPAQLTLHPETSVYDASDERWLSQVQVLLKQLNQDVGPVRKEVTPVPGQKGGAVELIVALGSAGAFTAAVTVFKSWLARDQTRTLTIEVDAPGGKKTIKLTGENISESVLKEALAAALK